MTDSSREARRVTRVYFVEVVQRETWEAHVQADTAAEAVEKAKRGEWEETWQTGDRKISRVGPAKWDRS